MTHGVDNRYPHLRRPLRLGGCTVANRIVRTAHTANMCVGGHVSDQLIAYHEARAAGGVGLTILEGSPVHPQTWTGLPGQLVIADDAFIPSLARLADRVRPHGMKLFQQLHHSGVNGPTTDGGPRWSSSDTPDPLTGSTPIPMTRAMIDEVVAAFAEAARRCEEAGLDGVEIHAGHGYLIHQFLTPVYNRREDGYGGSLENRMRLLCEVLSAARSAVSPDFPVGVRLSADDCAPGGMGPDEHAEVARRLDALGLVSYVNVSLGTYHNLGKIVGPMYEPEGYELPTSRVVTAAVSVPTIVAGRVLTLDRAEAIVAEGIAELVSMVRATIADPDMVRKSFAGEADRVRPCIGCNQGCFGLISIGLPMGCAVNPRAGREETVPEIERVATPGRYVVVGGGIAGMEAARAAALAGHRVTLFEAAEELGGQLAVAGRASSRSDLLRITRWLADEQGRSGVDVRLGVAATVADVLAEEPDLVILATGSERVADGFQRWQPMLEVDGIDLPHVVTSLDVLRGFGLSANDAVVFDDRWGAEAVSVAETLLDRGAAVTFVTSAPALAPGLELSLSAGRYRKRLLADERFDMYLRHALTTITEDRVTLRGLDDGRTKEVTADLVVHVARPLARRHLADELRDQGVAVAVVGDALEATDLLHAIHSGYLAAATIRPALVAGAR